MEDGTDEMTRARYFALRERLADMNYPTQFSPDSIDLLEKVFNDLLTTADSYKQLADKEKALSIDLSLAQAQLFPLKKENSRLAWENYQLHLDGIKSQDAITAKINDQVQLLSPLSLSTSLHPLYLSFSSLFLFLFFHRWKVSEID